MTKEKKPILGVELHIMGAPVDVVALPENTGGSATRYAFDWPAAVEVVPDRGEGFVGPLPVAIVLESADVDKLLAGLRAAGWSPAGWSPQP